MVALYVWGFYYFFVSPYGFRWKALFGEVSYPAGYDIHGIDVSHYQGDIDWELLRNQGSIDERDYELGLKAVARLYNTSIEKHGENQAVYLQKDRRKEIFSVGVLDIEKSQLPGIMPDPWHTDTCIGNWFYDVRDP